MSEEYRCVVVEDAKRNYDALLAKYCAVLQQITDRNMEVQRLENALQAATEVAFGKQLDAANIPHSEISDQALRAAFELSQEYNAQQQAEIWQLREQRDECRRLLAEVIDEYPVGLSVEWFASASQAAGGGDE